MSKTNKFPLLFTVLAMVCSCLSSCIPEASGSEFEKNIPTKNINHDIKLSIPAYLEQVQDSPEEIYLLLTNHSQNLIRFPIDMGIQLFAYNDQTGDWEEIENSTNYTVFVLNLDEESAKRQLEEEGGIPLFPEGSSFAEPSTMPIDADPNLTGRKFPVTVRILIIGTIFRDKKPSQEKVAAYYDIVINQQ